jgi:hypothetical protein
LRESGYDPAQGTFSVRFVTIGSQAKAEEFCGQQGMAAYCIGDPDKRTYAEMGLEGSQAVPRQTASDCQTYVRMVTWQGEAGRVGATARDFV